MTLLKSASKMVCPTTSHIPIILFLLLFMSPALLPAQIEGNNQSLTSPKPANSQRTAPVTVDTWTQEETQRWVDSTSTWETYLVRDITRDNQNRITQYVDREPGPGGLQTRFRFTFAWLGNSNKLTERFIELWNGNNWEPFARSLADYDLQENPILETDITWFASQADTSAVRRSTNTYSANNQLQQVLTEVRNPPNAFQPSARISYSYSALNELDTLNIEVWLGQWTNSSRLLYTPWFDYSLDLPMEEIEQRFNPSTSWTDFRRRSYTYGPNNSWEENIEDLSGDPFAVDSRAKEEFDAQGRPFYTDFTELTVGNPRLVSADSFFYDYNTNLQPTQVVQRIYDDSNQSWINFIRTLYRYNTVNRPEPTATGSLRIYPQPTKNEIHLQFTQAKGGAYQLQLFDLHGKQVEAWTWTQASGSAIQTRNVSQLPAGIYFYHLETPEGTQTGKLLKQ